MMRSIHRQRRTRPVIFAMMVMKVGRMRYFVCHCAPALYPAPNMRAMMVIKVATNARDLRLIGFGPPDEDGNDPDNYAHPQCPVERQHHVIVGGCPRYGRETNNARKNPSHEWPKKERRDTADNPEDDNDSEQCQTDLGPREIFQPFTYGGEIKVHLQFLRHLNAIIIDTSTYTLSNRLDAVCGTDGDEGAAADEQRYAPLPAIAVIFAMMVTMADRIRMVNGCALRR